MSEFTAKARTGPPENNEEDQARECWAGVVPLRHAASAPIDDARLMPGMRTPRYVTDYARPGAVVDPGGR